MRMGRIANDFSGFKAIARWPPGGRNPLVLASNPSTPIFLTPEKPVRYEKRARRLAKFWQHRRSDTGLTLPSERGNLWPPSKSADVRLGGVRRMAAGERASPHARNHPDSAPVVVAWFAIFSGRGWVGVIPPEYLAQEDRIGNAVEELTGASPRPKRAVGGNLLIGTTPNAPSIWG
jgi:hypothetical protein